MTNKKILLIGGGGHCRSVLDCLLSAREYDEIGIIDNKKDGNLLGISVVGTDDDLPKLLTQGWQYAAITVGSVGNTSVRRRLYAKMKEYGFLLPAIISPSAIIGRDTCFGEGVFVGKRAVINSGSRIGDCAIINTGAILEHDCRIGGFSHIGPGSVLCGNVCVGENSHVGVGSVVRQQIQIGNNALIGAGSVVVQNVQDGVEAFGNPCKVVKVR